MISLLALGAVVARPGAGGVWFWRSFGQPAVFSRDKGPGWKETQVVQI
jgi:hypothetical protein